MGGGSFPHNLPGLYLHPQACRHSTRYIPRPIVTSTRAHLLHALLALRSRRASCASATLVAQRAPPWCRAARARRRALASSAPWQQPSAMQLCSEPLPFQWPWLHQCMLPHCLQLRHQAQPRQPLRRPKNLPSWLRTLRRRTRLGQRVTLRRRWTLSMTPGMAPGRCRWRWLFLVEWMARRGGRGGLMTAPRTMTR